MHQSPIPPYLRGAEAGSFAEDTIVRRLPEIARRIIAENDFDETTNLRLRSLVEELPHGTIRPLQETNAPDWANWQRILQPFLGQTWLEMPFIAAETIFYRRVLEITGYFQPGPGYQLDPFRLQKKLGLDQAGAALTHMLPGGLPALHHLIHRSLWGNQADLSVWPVQGESGGKAQGGGGESHLLVDQSAAAIKLIENLYSGRIDLILDNSGTELCFDLLLANALLEQNPRLSVRLHIKPHPCFVSDAIEPDVTKAIHWLSTTAPEWVLPAAQHLAAARQSGRLKVMTHPFWTSPTPAWEMPTDLRTDLSGSALLISKGDFNYRRWLGDACWPSAIPLSEVIKPPAPLLLLRVLKSDAIAGLAPGQAAEMFKHDPAWLSNGQWGVIQFVDKNRFELNDMNRNPSGFLER